MNAFWNRLASLFGAKTASGSNASPEDTGLIGSRLSAVQATDDFFVFFNFAPIGEEKLPDGLKLISFKPTGDAFKALVTLHVTVDSQGIIRKLHLAIVRSFIDDPMKCIYAADLAKSFLARAVTTSTGEEVDSLVAEISARSMARSAMPMLTRQSLPQVSGAPSVAYQTYAGNTQAQTLLYKSGRFQLLLRNEVRAQETMLDLIVSENF